MELRTHQGKTVRFYDDLVKDKIVVINFMYTTCDGICIPTTSNLVRVSKLLGSRVGRDVFFYSLTLRPESDSVEELKKYAARHNVGKGWLFLTGKDPDIELLRRGLGFTDPDPKLDADRTNHVGMLRYGNERKMLWAGCPALSKPEAIAKAIGWVS